MRLIDADALLEEVENEQKYLIARGQLSEEHILVHALKRPVLDAPTVDAVPVVRCADCRHMDDSFHTDGFDGMCRYWKCHSTDYSWFCSNGERRSE